MTTRITQQVKVWRDNQWVMVNEVEHKEATTVREFKSGVERQVWRTWYTYENPASIETGIGPECASRMFA